LPGLLPGLVKDMVVKRVKEVTVFVLFKDGRPKVPVQSKKPWILVLDFRVDLERGRDPLGNGHLGYLHSNLPSQVQRYGRAIVSL
jgi:hypothetical protein